MKTLWIIRHAHASGNYATNDHSRMLSSLGEADARKIATFLSLQPDRPVFVVHSDAMRTTQTAHAIQGVLDIKAHAESALYNADTDELLDVITSQSNALESIAIVAHNPGVSYLATQLSGKSVSLDPAGVVKIVIDSDRWSDVDSASTLSFFVQAANIIV